ncbi:MAG: replication factor C small subunit [Candidatus Thermoplasmatota archaeon]
MKEYHASQDIWIEKYRPARLDDIVGQDAIIERLKAYAKTKTIPHMIFAGPAGTGKTTSAITLAKELYGEQYTQHFHELNASDERGIAVIRGKIKDYARTAPMHTVSFKIVFLDEADSLTMDAQSALRRTMERYTHICRFIFSVNYSSKIIEPIQSRCVLFRFKPIKPDDIKKYIRKIAVKEKIEITPDGLETLIYISQGDLRKAINTLQIGVSLDKKITAEVLQEATGTANIDDVKKLITTAFNGNFMAARNILYDLLINNGLSGEDIVKQIHTAIFDLTIPDEYKIQLIEKTGETEFRIVEGSNEHIQLETLLAHIMHIGKSSKLNTSL